MHGNFMIGQLCFSKNASGYYCNRHRRSVSPKYLTSIRDRGLVMDFLSSLQNVKKLGIL